MIWVAEIDVANAQELLAAAKREGKPVAIYANVGENIAQLSLAAAESSYVSVIGRNERRLS